jgi:NAD(P)-dependent dehydrogenase (short-subunit alcohol dehydrogenase family)
MSDTPVWFITGCSTGFGYELAKMVLERGFYAAITARDPARLAALKEIGGTKALSLRLDLTNPTEITEAVTAAQEHFGQIDVLVNNAGYGYQTSVEEGEDAEIRAQFEANVFGLFAMTRAVLPGMRARRRGHIMNISSVAGFAGFAASGYYAASKHAVEGFSDSLAAETAKLGIKVTCIEPGPFRTDWAGRSLKQTISTIPDYADTVAKRMKTASENSGHQPGDPVRAAAAMIKIAEIPKPPRHLVMGAIGVEAVTKRLNAALADIETWRETSIATDYPKD